jgi:hypothetical protein
MGQVLHGSATMTEADPRIKSGAGSSDTAE